MTYTIIMPDLGQTTSEGEILKWLKQPGDKVTKGEFLLEVETDKVTMEVEAFRSGYLREILAGEGQIISAGTPIAIVTDTVEEAYEQPIKESVPSPAVPPSPVTPSASPTLPSKFSAAPAARSLASERGIDLGKVVGTGPGGLITRKDVERSTAERTDLNLNPISGMARLTAKSKQTIPHFYVTVEVNVSIAEQWRKDWNANHSEVRASVNDVFVRAASRALRDVPALNTSYRNGRCEPRSVADVLLVVETEPGLLLVPLPESGNLPWNEYLVSVRGVLDKAKQSRVAELPSQGTPLLAISNLGMFGVKQFAAIIPPQCTVILAIGAIREELVYSTQPARVGQVCSLTLSVDHRVIDGITAAKFLERMQEHLNTL